MIYPSKSNAFEYEIARRVPRTHMEHLIKGDYVERGKTKAPQEGRLIDGISRILRNRINERPAQRDQFNSILMNKKRTLDKWSLEKYQWKQLHLNKT